MKVSTLEYMTHKAQYDATYYASPLKGDPSHVSLRLRTRHAGNQPGSRQCDELISIAQRASRIIRNQGVLYRQFALEYQEYQRARRRSHKDPNRYDMPHLHRSWSCSTLNSYIRCRLRAKAMSVRT